MSLVVVNQSGEGDQTNLEEYSWTRHIKSHTDSRHTTIKQTSEIVGNLNEASRAFLSFKIPIIAFQTSRTSKTLKNVMTFRATFKSPSNIICIFFKHSFPRGTSAQVGRSSSASFTVSFDIFIPRTFYQHPVSHFGTLFPGFQNTSKNQFQHSKHDIIHSDIQFFFHKTIFSPKERFVFFGRTTIFFCLITQIFEFQIFKSVYIVCVMIKLVKVYTLNKEI